MFPNNILINYMFVALAGVGSISTSLVLTGWVAEYYPAYARATATGWALSFARIGAISGPLIGGWIAFDGVALPMELRGVRRCGAGGRSGRCLHSAGSGGKRRGPAGRAAGCRFQHHDHQLIQPVPAARAHGACRRAGVAG